MPIVLSPFHQAIFDGNLPLVKKLHQEGIDLNTIAPSDHDKTALHIAAEWGHAEIAEYLCQHGVDVNALNKHQHSPLAMAILTDHPDVLKILIQFGANVDIELEGKGGALHAAALRKSLGSVKILCAHKDIDVRTKNKYGCTALQGAAANIPAEVLKLLIKELLTEGQPTALNFIDSIQDKDIQNAAKTFYFLYQKNLERLESSSKSLIEKTKSIFDEEDYNGRTIYHFSADFSAHLTEKRRVDEGFKSGIEYKAHLNLAKVHALLNESQESFLKSLDEACGQAESLPDNFFTKIIENKTIDDGTFKACLGIVAWKGINLDTLTLSAELAADLNEDYSYSAVLKDYIRKNFWSGSDEDFEQEIKKHEFSINGLINSKRRAIHKSSPSSLNEEVNKLKPSFANIRRLNSLARILATHLNIKDWKCVAVSADIDAATGKMYFNVAVNNPGDTVEKSQSTCNELHAYIQKLYSIASNGAFFNDKPTETLDKLIEEDLLQLPQRYESFMKAVCELDRRKKDLDLAIINNKLALDAARLELEEITNSSASKREKHFLSVPVRKKIDKFKRLFDSCTSELGTLEKTLKDTEREYDTAIYNAFRLRRDVKKVILSMRGEYLASDEINDAALTMAPDNDRNYLQKTHQTCSDPVKVRLIQTDVQRHCEQEIARRVIIEKVISETIKKLANHIDVDDVEQLLIDRVKHCLGLAADYTDFDNLAVLFDQADGQSFNDISKDILKIPEIVAKFKSRAENETIYIGVSFKCCPKCTAELKACSIPVLASHNTPCPTKGIFDEIYNEVSATPRGSQHALSSSRYDTLVLPYYRGAQTKSSVISSPVSRPCSSIKHG